MTDKKRIKEAIIVEGRDDEAKVREALEAMIIVTHGFGIKDETWKLIERAYREKGIIIFTDPDHAGEMIRRRIEERCPKAMHANLPREKAKKNKDIGIENAKTEDIVSAILSAKSKENIGIAIEDENRYKHNTELLRAEDIYALGIYGGEGARIKREKLCTKLGIGYCNAKGFVRRVNEFGISKEELMEALEIE